MFVRWMLRRDIDDVARIEDRVYEYPWNQREIARTLRQPRNVGLVAEVNGVIAAYMVYELRKRRLHLINIAVDPSMQRQGIGAGLIAKLQGRMNHRSEITAEVRERNLAAQLFMRSQGFTATEVLRDHYAECEEDAYLMVYRRPAAVLAEVSR